jgi:hypothetical protein
VNLLAEKNDGCSRGYDFKNEDCNQNNTVGSIVAEMFIFIYETALLDVYVERARHKLREHLTLEPVRSP